MSQSKGAAKKAAPAKKRARKASKAVAAPAPAAPLDWPPNLDDTKAQELFDLIESGDFTVKTAAAQLELKGANVYQWRKRYAKFGERLDEAVDIGIDMATDTYREITAFDRDSAAGANVKMTALDKYLQRKRPERFHTNPFKPQGTNTEFYVGVVMMPPKQARLPYDPAEVVDAQFSEVSVPAKVQS